MSIGLFISTFVLVSLDGLRSTLIYGWAERDFPASFLTAILVGETSGGFLATIIAAIQGVRINFSSSSSEQISGQSVGTNETLSTDFVFGPTVAFLIFCFICFIATVSLALFMMINGRISSLPKYDNDVEQDHDWPDSFPTQNQALLPSKEQKVKREISSASSHGLFQSIDGRPAHRYFLYFVLALSTGNLFTFAPSFFSFTTLPYRNQSNFVLAIEV